MKEIWRDVDGYGGNYKISNFGVVVSLSNGGAKPLKKFLSSSGYESVYLYNGSKKSRKAYRVHRLVALTFIPNPDKKPYINHKDGVKNNNCVENLEWVTQSENMRHAVDVLHRKTGKCTAVECVETGEVFKSQREASIALGLSPNSVCIAMGKRAKNCSTAAGLHFVRKS